MGTELTAELWKCPHCGGYTDNLDEDENGTFIRCREDPEFKFTRNTAVRGYVTRESAIEFTMNELLSVVYELLQVADQPDVATYKQEIRDGIETRCEKLLQEIVSGAETEYAAG